jgi:hypothetical protein
MARLFIANVTKQNFMFTYRFPERSQPCTQRIDAGGQICVAPNGSNTDLAQQEIDYILQQYEKYGIQEADKIDHSKGPFNGICYSIGKQISVEKLRKAVIKNEQALDRLGREMRQEAAVAAHNELETKFLGEQTKKSVDISVEEVIPSQGLNEELTHISEGVRVTRNPTNDMPVVDLMQRSRR